MVSVNSMWCSILIHSKLPEIFDIEIFWCKGCWEGSYYNYNILFNNYNILIALIQLYQR